MNPPNIFSTFAEPWLNRIYRILQSIHFHGFLTLPLSSPSQRFTHWYTKWSIYTCEYEQQSCMQRVCVRDRDSERVEMVIFTSVEFQCLIPPCNFNIASSLSALPCRNFFPARVNYCNGQLIKHRQCRLRGILNNSRCRTRIFTSDMVREAGERIEDDSLLSEDLTGDSLDNKQVSIFSFSIIWMPLWYACNFFYCIIMFYLSKIYYECLNFCIRWEVIYIVFLQLLQIKLLLGVVLAQGAERIWNFEYIVKM